MGMTTLLTLTAMFSSVRFYKMRSYQIGCDHEITKIWDLDQTQHLFGQVRQNVPRVSYVSLLDIWMLVLYKSYTELISWQSNIDTAQTKSKLPMVTYQALNKQTKILMFTYQVCMIFVFVSILEFIIVTVYLRSGRKSLGDKVELNFRH